MRMSSFTYSSFTYKESNNYANKRLSDRGEG
jgi:hypothetical protein